MAIGGNTYIDLTERTFKKVLGRMVIIMISSEYTSKQQQQTLSLPSIVYMIHYIIVIHSFS